MSNSLLSYFDYAAATPVAKDVLAVMEPYFSDDFYNPSALYGVAHKVREDIEQARRKVAHIIGVKPREIIFTSGCTEANNLALQGVMQANPGGKVVISAIEHDSIRIPAENYDCSKVPVDKNGAIDLDALKSLITDDVVLISIIYVNNETGSVQPLRKISELVKLERKRRGANGRPIYLHTDAAQAPNIRPINHSSIGVDLMSLNGGKIYGPKGSGCLFVSSHVAISPLLQGGGQELGLRSGTENTPGIIGFAHALSSASERQRSEVKRLGELRQYLITQLESLGGEVVGVSPANASESIVSVLLKGCDNESIVFGLDAYGVSISSGSACHASSGKKSYVLHALGLSVSESQSVIRISMGRYSTREGIDVLVKSIRSILASS